MGDQNNLTMRHTLYIGNSDQPYLNNWKREGTKMAGQEQEAGIVNRTTRPHGHWTDGGAIPRGDLSASWNPGTGNDGHWKPGIPCSKSD